MVTQVARPSVAVAAPLPLSIKPLVLPEVAVKLALGARITRPAAGQILVSFEDEVISISEVDFDLVSRAAKRLKPKVTGRSPAAVLTLSGLAHKYVCEEVFSPGTLRVLYFPSMTKASAFYRCLFPASALLSGSQKVVAHVAAGGISREALDYDVIVIQIGHRQITLKFMETLQAMGKKVIYEIDDAFDALEPWHPSYDFYKQSDVQDQVFKMIETADAVTVTTENLAIRYGGRARRMQVMPNYIPYANWPRSTPHGTDEFRVLWAGSHSHSGDLEVVAPALEQFATANRNVRLVFFGKEPPGMNLPQDQVRVLPFCEFEEYPVKLAEANADVAIAPLADIDFNRAKSNLKILEYSACGYPVIASYVEPYAKTIQHSVNGFLAASQGAWLEYLQALYERKDLRESIAREGRKIAERFDIDKNVRKLEDFFMSLRG